jgi:hypothetical protein
MRGWGLLGTEIRGNGRSAGRGVCPEVNVEKGWMKGQGNKNA